MNETRNEIKLLVVDDNQELCDILESYFELIDDVTLCGVAHNGEEALQKIARLHPDVVLLDIIMPQLDGISVLERLRQTPPERIPRIIVASAIGQELITNQALELGANYYMIKPYQLPDLLGRIRLVTKEMRREPAPLVMFKAEKEQESLPVSGRIAEMLIERGMPTNVVGYQYCVHAIEILLTEDKHCLLGKDVYRTIAERYETTDCCVESAIRKAVSLMGKEKDKQMSNGRFLTMMAEQFRLHAMRYRGEG